MGGGLTVVERLDLIERVREAYEGCPCCDEELLGVDHTNADGVLFIHEEKGMFVDGCSVDPLDLERLEDKEGGG